MLKTLLKNITMVVPLAIVLFLASLRITHTSTGVRQVGSPDSLCTICGSYNVEVRAKGWPMTSFNDVYSANSLESYPEAALQPSAIGVLADFSFWLLISELIVVPLTFIHKRKIKH